jgi:hypothetical protein
MSSASVLTSLPAGCHLTTGRQLAPHSLVMVFLLESILNRISGSQSGDYEEFYVLGHNNM